MEEVPQSLAHRKSYPFPARVKGRHSQKFQNTQISTNHYQVSLRPFDKIVIFKIKFTPPIAADNRKQRIHLMDSIKPQLTTMIKNPIVSGFNVYSHEEGMQNERDFKCGSFVINIKQVKIFDIRENPKILLTFLNNALRGLMRKKQYIQIGKTGKFFNSVDKKSIDSLMVFSGYKANFVYLESGYYLRVDSVKKVVRNQSVLQFIDTFYQMHNGKDKQEKRNLLKAELINKTVMTNYGTMRYHKIIDIQFRDCQEVMVRDQVNMPTYYKERYNIIINKFNQPLLQVQSRNQNSQNPTLIFPELCLMTGIPESFDQFRRKKISQASILKPPQKMKEIQGLIDKIKGENELREMSQLGVELKFRMSQFKAQLIPVPSLALGNNKTVDKGRQSFFNLFDKPIYSSKHSVQCGIVYTKGADFQQLKEVFINTGAKLGIKIKVQLFEASNKAAKDIITQIQNASHQMNIVVVILPGQLKNEYKRIKKTSIVNIEIVTQVVTELTLRKKGFLSIATKILLQVIAKRGNTLWVPQTLYKFDKVMLLGFDTAKSTTGETVITGCATINSTFSSLFTAHKSYQVGQRKFHEMCDLTNASIRAYSQRNGYTPRQLIILFNSCTGDQVSLYHDLFFNRLLLLLAEGFPGHNICVTGIMVNTKNSERFFLNDGDIRNAKAGTLISQKFVSKDYDFFLVSQESKSGSTVPNHYRVIFSNSKLEEAAFQELMFSQCFNYVNWTGSIKVPAILQYAKKASKFIADVMEDKKASDSIASKPYFV